jgi:hypothetical protein
MNDSEIVVSALLFWLLCGVVAGMIGRPKGAGLLALFLGVFLGPFGILIAIFLKGNQKECSHCAKLIPGKATKCPFCQSSLYN